MKLECLEIMNDLLRRFASALTEAEAKECLTALFGELTSARAAARKRAIACIASLSASLPDRMTFRGSHTQYHHLSHQHRDSDTAAACPLCAAAGMLEGELVGQIFTQMNAPSVKLELRRTYIQTLSAISRSGGAAKLAKQVDKVIPLILDQGMPYADNGDPEMIELLQAFESFVLRCPMRPASTSRRLATRR